MTLKDLTDTKRSNMKISTFDAVQTVKYVLRSRGKTGIGMFKRDDINMGPVDKTLCQNIRAAGRRDKTDRGKRTEAKQKRQAEYGCSATCESAEKAKTTALAKERQTRLKHVKKMNAARQKALDTLQEVARKKNFQNFILLYVPIGVGRGCRGVGGNVSIWIFAAGRGLQLPLSFLTIHVFASLVM